MIAFGCNTSTREPLVMLVPGLLFLLVVCFISAVLARQPPRTRVSLLPCREGNMIIKLSVFLLLDRPCQYMRKHSGEELSVTSFLQDLSVVSGPLYVFIVMEKI